LQLERFFCSQQLFLLPDGGIGGALVKDRRRKGYTPGKNHRNYDQQTTIHLSPNFIAPRNSTLGAEFQRTFKPALSILHDPFRKAACSAEVFLGPWTPSRDAAPTGEIVPDEYLCFVAWHSLSMVSSIDGLWSGDCSVEWLVNRDELLPGTLALLILKTLARGREMHGYEIARSIQRVSEDVLRIEEGSLYPALQRMLAKAGEGGVGRNRRESAGTLLPADPCGEQAVGTGKAAV
jgi:hypothetical protein